MATSVTKNPAVSSPADGNDSLYGYGGDDSMDARGGKDYLYDAGDVVYEAAGGGTGTFILTGGNGDNSLAVDHSGDFLTEPGAAFNRASSFQDNRLMVNAPASETADNLASLLPTYSINEIADYIKEGFWDWRDTYYRSFDMGDSFPTGNNGILYYNYSGFSGISGPGTDTDGLTTARRALVDYALDYLGEILGINFVQTTTTGTGVDLFYYDNDPMGGAFSNSALFGTGNGTSNHRYIDYSWVNVASSWWGGNSDINGYTYQTIIHETLHALGLGHSGPYNGTVNFITDTTQATTNNNIYLNDSWQQSIMSYIDQIENTTVDADLNYVISVMAGDMEALRDYYGYAAFTGNTIYGFNTNIAATTSQVMHDLSNFAEVTAFCIIDDGGTDTVDFSGYWADQNINLAIASGSSTTGSISDIGGQIGNMTIAVGTVIENAVGGPGADNITGNTAANSLTGGGGYDYIFGDSGNDTLHGGTGNDTLDGWTGDDLLYGEADNDYLDGGAGDDTMYGGTGNDTLDGWTDADLLYGEDGNDTLWGYIGNDTLSGGAGNDTLYGEGDNDSLDGGSGNDTMSGSTGDDTYVVDSASDVVTEYASAGADRVNAYVNYTLGAEVENLYLYGTATVGTGNDLDNYIDTTVSTNNYTLSGLGGNDTLRGYNGIDNLYGGAGNDSLYGYDGNDSLDGGSGDDSMSGMGSDDTYVVDSAGDVVTESAGYGTDTVNAYINYTLGANVENLNLYGPASSGTGNELDNWIDTTVSTNNYTLSGLGGNDTLRGYNGIDNLFGGAGNDSLYGYDGNDYLDGGSGNDSMNGMAGDDTYVVDSAGDVVSESAGDSTDNVYAFVNYNLGANVENLYLYGTANSGTGNDLNNIIDGMVSTNNYTLSGLGGNDSLIGYNGADSLYGGTGNDYLSGYGGNDYLDGGAGNDTMYGSGGNDTYVVDSALDVVTESVGAGTENVYAYVNYTLGANVENLWLYGSATVGTGNELDNYINTEGPSTAYTLSGLGGNDSLIGYNANDTLYGGDGNDVLSGLDGNDSLDGGAGSDAMSGGTGDDLYVVDSLGDVVTEAASAGTDWVNAYVNYTLGANVENLVLYGPAPSGTGNNLNNQIIGAEGSTAYTLSGLAGNDAIVGYNSTDSLYGGDGNDSLFAYGGNDYLDGGAGNDTMYGMTGNDTCIVDSAGDVVSEDVNEGTADTVNAYVNYTLGANVENLNLYGTASSGTGNGLDNLMQGKVAAINYTLSGGAGNDALVALGGSDVLDGGTGSDTMAGGFGDDTYYVDSAGDVVTEALNAGLDRVNAYINYTQGANVENLYLYGTTLNGTGNGLNNAIYGNNSGNTIAGLDGNDNLFGYGGNDTLLGGAGNDNLNGGTGNDAMTGGAGDDTYVVDSAGDVVTEAVGGGLDRVNAYVNYTLGAEVENLYLFSPATVGTGNGLNNAIYGNAAGESLFGLDGNDNLYGLAGTDTLLGGAGNDILTGGAGNDTMSGGAGNDLYIVDSAGDVAVEAAGEGTDRVNTYVNYTLSDNVENLYLFDAATNGTGNAQGNIIAGTGSANNLYGLSGNDTLYGYDGDDNLTGGAGADYLSGGNGQDRFILAESGLSNRDVIADLAHLNDSIVLKDIIDGAINLAINGLAFTGGVLNAGKYFEGAGSIGNGVQDSGIYNDTTYGNIYYNPTSGVAGDSVLICTVGAATAASVDNTDFLYSA